MPGLNKFFDVKISKDTVKILSERGEELFLDKVNLTTQSGNVKSYRTHAYKAFNF